MTSLPQCSLSESRVTGKGMRSCDRRRSRSISPQRLGRWACICFPHRCFHVLFLGNHKFFLKEKKNTGPRMNDQVSCITLTPLMTSCKLIASSKAFSPHSYMLRRRESGLQSNPWPLNTQRCLHPHNLTAILSRLQC